LNATSGVGGVADLSFSGNVAVGACAYLTATATDAVGDTSEFSRAILVEGPALTPSGISAEVQNQAPPPLQGGSQRVGPRPKGGPSLGDGNGDGILGSLEPNVCSFPGISGKWWTLVSPAGTQLAGVSPSGPPDFASLPPGYDFPLGFATFTVQGLAAGATLMVTNVLHDALSFDTVWAYGPTPDSAQPHWYEFLFDGQVGARLSPYQFTLTFVDGQRGDDDLMANGRVTALLAPARRLSSAPVLQLVGTSLRRVEDVSVSIDAGGHEVLATNQVPLVSATLTWPASATNYALFYLTDLGSTEAIISTNLLVPSSTWLPVPESPVIRGAQNVLTNAAVGSARFYQLRPF
jgi:hypothetical protein